MPKIGETQNGCICYHVIFWILEKNHPIGWFSVAPAEILVKMVMDGVL